MEGISTETADAIFHEYGTELLAFLIGVLRDNAAAEDVRQIAFRRLLEAGHSAQRETIKGWLFKVALREAIQYRRQSDRQQRHLQSYSLTQSGFQSTDSLVDDLTKAEDVDRIRHLLSQLPMDQQQVVRQRIYEQKTFAEIAHESNLPIGTILTRMRLAVAKLRSWFETK